MIGPALNGTMMEVNACNALQELIGIHNKRNVFKLMTTVKPGIKTLASVLLVTIAMVTPGKMEMQLMENALISTEIRLVMQLIMISIVNASTTIEHVLNAIQAMNSIKMEDANKFLNYHQIVKVQKVEYVLNVYKVTF